MIEHGGGRNNDDECPTPQGAIFYQRPPTLLLEIVTNRISKEAQKWDVPHIETERNRCDPA
jgi:hypothetical protein